MGLENWGFQHDDTLSGNLILLSEEHNLTFQHRQSLKKDTWDVSWSEYAEHPFGKLVRISF